jgi:parallel beta-helix repeat protein
MAKNADAKTFNTLYIRGANLWGSTDAGATLTGVSNLICTARGQRIELKWTNPAPEEISIHIERSPNGSTGWSEIASLSPRKEQWDDITPEPSETWHYRIRTYDGSTYSPYCNSHFATTAAGIVYYVSPTGVDVTNTGLSDGQAWATLNYALSQISDGDVVKVKRNGTYTGDTQTDVVNKNNWKVTTYGTGNRPLFDFSMLGQDFKGLIQAGGSSSNRITNITIAGLHVYDIAGEGFRVTYGDHALIQDCYTDRTYRGGISFRWTNNSTVRGCYSTAHGVGFGESIAHPVSGETPSTWPRGISAYGAAGNGNNPPINWLFEDNVVWQGYGEGISCYQGANTGTIQDNIVYDNRAVSIYINAGWDVTVRRNIVFGDYWSAFDRNGTGWVAEAIATANEAYQYAPLGGMPASYYTYNITIENNLCANTLAGVSIGAVRNGDTAHGFTIINNTLISNEEQIQSFQSAFTGTNRIANNVFHSPDTGTADYPSAITDGDITWDSNYWGSAPDVAMRDAGDVYGDVAGVATFAKSTTWQTTYGSYTGLNHEDFRPAALSTVLDAGTEVTGAPDHDHTGADVDSPRNIGALNA